MITRILHRLALFGLIALILASVITAVAAANTVPPSRLTNQSRPITANDLKPPQCAALNLTAIVVGNGVFSGTNANELILGGPNADTIDGRAGKDCILGGGGDDYIDGGAHTDVCIGGPGNDTFFRCETEIQ
ncbi:MAG: hypothetical protein KKA65_06095 [Nanoarchaeota archaeon]|nr:hypothetical protein [Nanoarchaeota archaeon]